MSKYRCSQMAELGAQLRRGPRRLRLRQLAAIEFTLSVTEPSRSYPVEFLVHSLTGFRPPTAQPDAVPVALAGEDVRLDLILLAEELSADADLNVELWQGRVSTVGQVAERFGVSTKTIFRWHKRGLIGWRMRFADRRFRLVFPEHCVRRFVARNGDLVNRGSSFSQLTRAERRQIITRAESLVAEGRHRTINSVAKVLSGESGRAVETIRLILKSHDEARPKAGIFNRVSLEVPPDDRRLAIWEAHLEGLSVAAIATKFRLGHGEAYALVTEMRAREMKSSRIDFISSEEFSGPDAEARIVNCPDLDGAGEAAEDVGRVPPGLPPYLQQLFRFPLLSREQEVALFRLLNFLRFQADQAREQIDPERVTAAQLDAIDALLARAGQVKSRITQANLRLVVSIAKRHTRPTQDFFELVSDGNVSLMRAVDRFDYSRGFKFSTYASWAIIKNFARSVPEEKALLDRFQTGRDELLEHCVGVTPEDQEGDDLPAMRTTIERMLDTLDDRDREILRQRFGLDEHKEPKTLEQIGQHFGVSKERIRQLEARAIARLRSDFEDEASITT